MKALVVGLGSMGKRRVRNLQTIGGISVCGFDVRRDRNDEAASKYGIGVFNDFNEAIREINPDFVVISVSPDLHMLYANMCFEKRIPFFIEASVTDRNEVESLSVRATEAGLVAAPSCTMRFHPGPMEIKKLIGSKVIGQILSINYQTGQYLPDWHPWESIHDFYVTKRTTGAGREIVPFELTWLNDIFGVPVEVLSCAATKLTELEMDIDDIYHCLIKYPENVLLNMTVEVISRPIATREMLIIGSTGKLKYSGESNSVGYCNLETNGWVEIPLDLGTVEEMYINAEEPYINEMRSFVDAVESGKQSDYPNSLHDDAKVLKILEALESKNSL
ncbi:Gfo/Idh/MocA family oxidoreductase [Pseudomonadales bacterium]|nr:Gfo/Idh/MocA family oxidoreductase [Pseudomonadales bacterium]